MQRITAFAPGRIEVLGNHTDYNLGCVLSCAIPLGVTVHAGGCRDGYYTFVSDGYEGNARRGTEEAWTPRRGFWGNYPLGVLEVLREEDVRPPAFSARVESTVPPGAGLSSSAAMEVATAYTALALAGVQWSPLRIARACRRAENVYAGVQCGLLDQLTSVAGEEGRLVHIDFRDETYERQDAPSDHLFLVFGSGVPHTLAGGEYNERRMQCAETAKELGAASLREVDIERLRAGKSKLREVVYRRALHVVGENARVAAAVAALGRGDAVALGRLMSESHRSSVANFENSTPYLDALVGIAEKTPGILGARLTGGGFGGAIVALAAKAQAAAACAAVEREYSKATGKLTYGLELTPWRGGGIVDSD